VYNRKKYITSFRLRIKYIKTPLFQNNTSFKQLGYKKYYDYQVLNEAGKKQRKRAIRHFNKHRSEISQNTTIAELRKEIDYKKITYWSQKKCDDYSKRYKPSHILTLAIPQGSNKEKISKERKKEMKKKKKEKKKEKELKKKYGLVPFLLDFENLQVKEKGKEIEKKVEPIPSLLAIDDLQKSVCEKFGEKFVEEFNLRIDEYANKYKNNYNYIIRKCTDGIIKNIQVLYDNEQQTG